MRSPQMLMVSGIGQRELLTELGINVVADLPGVGQNMWVGTSSKDKTCGLAKALRTTCL